MARTKKANNEVQIVVDSKEVQLVSPELEVKLNNNLANTPVNVTEVEILKDENTVSIVKPQEPKVAPVKMVKILMSDNHKCYIGGEWYYLLKNKHYNVPENVKTILKRANKLQTL